MPWRTISGGDRPARSILLSRMWPRSGVSAPVIRLKNVLLPAPLGPITAVSEPSAKLNVISSAALTPPNDLESCWISSMASRSPPSRFQSTKNHSSPPLRAAVAACLVPFYREVHQTFAQPNGKEQDHDAEH